MAEFAPVSLTFTEYGLPAVKGDLHALIPCIGQKPQETVLAHGPARQQSLTGQVAA
jgi:hypothetical protein